MLSLETFLTLLTVIYLLGYTFFPDRIRVDKYTLTLLAFLFLLTIMPTLSSGSISYLFSFRRTLAAARKAVKKATGKESASDEEALDSPADQRGPFFTTADIKEKLRQELLRLQDKKLPKEERIQPADALRLAVHLKYKNVISADFFDAVSKLVNLCDIVDCDSKLTPPEIQQLINLSIPILTALSEV